MPVTSAVVGVHEIDKLIVHPVGLLSSGADRARRAVLQVIAHQLPANATKRLLHRRYLGEDIGAVAVVSDHLLPSSPLPLDAAQSFEIPRLPLRIDGDSLSRGRSISHPAAAFHGLTRCLPILALQRSSHIVSLKILTRPVRVAVEGCWSRRSPS